MAWTNARACWAPLDQELFRLNLASIVYSAYTSMLCSVDLLVCPFL